MSENIYEAKSGRTFYFGKLPAYDGIRVQVALLKVLGEPLFKAAASKADKEEAEMGALAIGTMMARLEEDEVIKVIDTVMKIVTIKKENESKAVRVNVEEHFIGQPLEIWMVTLHALRYNFEDFLPESLFNSLKERAMGVLKPSTPQTSTGTSGDQ